MSDPITEQIHKVDEAGVANPEPMVAGTFALYEDGVGGFVLVTQTEKFGVDRKHIPAALVKMAMGGGILGRKLGGLFGGA